MIRYPHIRVDARTASTLALVAEVRHALRRAGVERREILRFSAEALGAGDGEAVRGVCARWVETGR